LAMLIDQVPPRLPVHAQVALELDKTRIFI
jgi:hypothetical protein